MRTPGMADGTRDAARSAVSAVAGFALDRLRRAHGLAWRLAAPRAARSRRGMDLFRTLRAHEARHYSQNGEDGVIDCLMRLVGATNRFYVEIGSSEGEECNTRWLREQGWSGVMLDRVHDDPRIPVYRELVTVENLAPLFAKYGVPREFDLLSIDVDGNDYWLWKAAGTAYRPRVAVIEYNNQVPHDVSVTMPYDPAFQWTGQPSAGQSLLALRNVSESMGYALVYASAPNAFVVLRSLLPDEYDAVPLSAIARSWMVLYGTDAWGRGLSDEPWEYV